MKKYMIMSFAVLAAGLLIAGAAFATETATWSPDDPSIEIYKEATEAGYFTVDYDSIPAEKISIAEKIYLLMIDGGFMPNPVIRMGEGGVLVPVRLVSETLGATVDWSEQERLVTIRDGETEILLPVGGETATVNGAEIRLDTPAAIYNASTYVPLRFFADSFGAATDYIPQLTYGMDYSGEQLEYWIRARESVGLVLIDTGDPSESAFTMEDGLAAVQEASLQSYNDILGYLTVDGGRAIGDSGRGDYDPQAITYAGFDIGRYYTYCLEGFEEYPIFFNKYTGEMYSESVGLPFVFWIKGFPHLAFLYQ